MNPSEIHIVMFGSVAHDQMVQRSHQLARGLHEAGCRVTYVDPPAHLITPKPMRGGADRRSGAPSMVAGIPVITVPRFRIAGLNISVAPFLLRERGIPRYLRRALTRQDSERGRRVAIVQNPLQVSHIPFDIFDAVVYDCIDDYRVVTEDETGEMRPLLLALLERVDGVFVTSKTLEDQMHFNLKKQVPVVRIPNGVDDRWFLQQALETPSPPELASLGGPIIGYVGGIYQWIDLELVIGVARRRPRYAFVLVGPLSDDARQVLADRPENVTVIDEVPYDRIPSFINAFAVGMIPFNGGAIADTTDPIKLYEYFVLGKPVVSTPMRQLEDYALESLVWIGATPDEFAVALDHAMKDHSIDHGQSRVALARSHSWSTQAARAVEALTAILSPHS